MPKLTKRDKAILNIIFDTEIAEIELSPNKEFNPVPRVKFKLMPSLMDGGYTAWISDILPGHSLIVIEVTISARRGFECYGAVYPPIMEKP